MHTAHVNTHAFIISYRKEERNSPADGTVADKQASMEVSGEWNVSPQERLPRLQGAQSNTYQNL